MNFGTEVKDDSTKLELLDIGKLNDTVKMVGSALNTGCKGGIFSLDDAYLLKIGVSNLEKAVKVLDSYQKFALELKGKEESDKEDSDKNTFGKKKTVQTLSGLVDS